MGKVSRGWGGDWKSNSAKMTLLRPKKKPLLCQSDYQVDWWPVPSIGHGWHAAVKHMLNSTEDGLWTPEDPETKHEK
jgi:hypothetical protein